MKPIVNHRAWAAYRGLWRARWRRLAAACGAAPAGCPPALAAQRAGGWGGWGARSLGLTLLEVLITLTLVGLLTAIAVPSYNAYQDRIKIATAKSDILDISFKLERSFMVRNRYPTTLAEIGESRLDPWGAPYRYLSMEGATVGQKRKDRSLHPLNSDYDLYSMGPDGRSQTPLTARASRDDIIRANNGAFIGIAEDY